MTRPSRKPAGPWEMNGDQYNDAVLNAMNETEFQSWLIRAAIDRGWPKDQIYHQRVSIGTRGGWPDLVLIKGDRVLFWELKGPKGSPRPEQERCIAALQAAGREAGFWWPKDWRKVLEELER